MLDGVGDVDGVAVDAGRLAHAVEQLAGRADEGLAGQVFLVARLLADEHDLRLLRPFAAHGLGRELPQLAAPAFVEFRRLLALRLRILGRDRDGRALALADRLELADLARAHRRSEIMCVTILPSGKFFQRCEGMCCCITPGSGAPG
jgi:hypothetical protein